MRKNIKNDKVIRAMAIGISAMLASTSPMTALAAENEGVPEGNENNTSTATTDEGVCDKAQAAAGEAAEKVEDAGESADTVKDDVKTNVIAGEAGTDSKGNDLAQDVIDAAKEIEKTEVENDTPLADAKTDITNADDQLGIAEANDKLSDAGLDEAEEAAGKAADTAEDMKDAMQEAEQKVDEQTDKIENATTVEEANTAYDELEAAAKTAEETFNAKLEEYNSAKASYEEAAAKVAECEKAYNDAIATAGANAAEAETALAAAKEKAYTLEKAVKTAKEAVDTSAADAMAIAKAEENTQTDGGLNWKNEDALFIAIMEKYYLPEQCDITGAKVTRVQGKDNNDYNYFTAVYTDEKGVEQTKYFNYKMDGNSKDNIVIFEKREVEVFGGYVSVDEKEDGTAGVELTQKELDAGLKDGSIVQTKDGKYVIKGEESDDPIILVKEEKTSTGKTDILIDESSKQESYQLDENGNLVKTVTADVTTITYTDKTFISDKSYATDEERDAAAEVKKAELVDATGKDATIKETEETTYTYTANGTYIPTFTKTVNVKNEEVERKYSNSIFDDGVKTEGEAFKQVEEEQENTMRGELKNELKCDDLYLLGVQSDLDVTGATKDTWRDDSDFLVSGTVTATYAKVTKQIVDQSTFGALWDDIKALFGSGQSANDKLEAAAKEVIEAAGGIFLSADWVDWSYNKATIRYVEGVKVTTDEKDTEKEAKDAVADVALKQAKENGATGVYNVKTTGSDDIAHTTYSYEVNYLVQDKSNTEKQKAIETETFTNAEELTDNVTQNLKYLKNIILLTQDDTDYRDFVDSAKDLTAKYDRILKEAEQAKTDVVTAQTKVDELKKAIEKLKSEGNLDALKDLEAKLEIAEANKKEAEDAKNRILEKLEEAGDLLEEVVTALTPATDDTDDADDDEDEDVATVTATGDVVNVAAALAAAPVQTIAAQAQTTTTTTPENTVVIEEENTPLANTVNTNAEEKVEAEKAEEEKEVVAIEEEKAPLADAVEKETMSWWWWLLILLLGAAGYEMYKKHQEKKKAAEVEADKAE